MKKANVALFAIGLCLASSASAAPRCVGVESFNGCVDTAKIDIESERLFSECVYTGGPPGTCTEVNVNGYSVETEPGYLVFGCKRGSPGDVVLNCNQP